MSDRVVPDTPLRRTSTRGGEVLAKETKDDPWSCPVVSTMISMSWDDPPHQPVLGFSKVLSVRD